MITRRSNRGRIAQILGVVLLGSVGAVALTGAQTAPPQVEATPPAVPQETIAQLHRQAEKQVNDHHYEAGLETVKQILKLDPKDEYAAGIAPLLEDKVQFINSSAGKNLPATKPAPKVANPDEVRARVLNRVLPSVQFDAVGFSDVIDFLRDISGVNISVNWKVIEAAGMDRHTPVTSNIHNVKFGKALELILDNAGSAANGRPVILAYSFEDGVLSISTKEDLSKNVVIRVYDIRDLLKSVSDKPATPADREQMAQQMTRLIQDNIDTSSWKGRGGSVAAVKVVDTQGVMIITQTAENHRQVAALLARVREVRAMPTTRPAHT